MKNLSQIDDVLKRIWSWRMSYKLVRFPVSLICDRDFTKERWQNPFREKIYLVQIIVNIISKIAFSNNTVFLTQSLQLNV